MVCGVNVPVGKGMRHDAVSRALAEYGEPVDCRTLSDMLGFPAGPSLRHLFVSGQVDKVDRNGYKGSYRYMIRKDMRR